MRGRLCKVAWPERVAHAGSACRERARSRKCGWWACLGAVGGQECVRARSRESWSATGKARLGTKGVRQSTPRSGHQGGQKSSPVEGEGGSLEAAPHGPRGLLPVLLFLQDFGAEGGSSVPAARVPPAVAAPRSRFRRAGWGRARRGASEPRRRGPGCRWRGQAGRQPARGGWARSFGRPVCLLLCFDFIRSDLERRGPGAPSPS